MLVSGIIIIDQDGEIERQMNSLRIVYLAFEGI